MGVAKAGRRRRANDSAMFKSGPSQGHPGARGICPRGDNKWADNRPPTTYIKGDFI